VTLRAARYMVQFRCVGPACIDDCCNGWEIDLDREHHDALRERMTSPEDRALFARAVRATGDARPGQHALLVLDDAQRCHFLTPDRACSIHARFGEEALGDACSRYPRIIGRLDAQVELAGAASCPEIVRLLMTVDDATELVPAELAAFGRGQISHALDRAAATPYEAPFGEVRALALRLLGERRFPVATRLFFIAWVARRAYDQLRCDVTADHTDLVRGLARALEDPATLDELARQHATMGHDRRFALSIVRELVCLPERFLSRAFRELRDALVPLFAERGAELARGADPAAIERAYGSLPPPSPLLEERLDVAISGFASNHLLVDWYTKYPTFLNYVFGLLTRVATIRFVTRGHAALAGDLDREAADRLIVRVVYAFSRVLAHNEALTAKLLDDLERQGVFELDDAAALTRV
jgi:hypothetical protein